MAKTKPMQAAPAAERSQDELFKAGDQVRLASGRVAKLIRRVTKSVPPGWVVEGEIGVVAEVSLTPLDTE